MKLAAAHVVIGIGQCAVGTIIFFTAAICLSFHSFGFYIVPFLDSTIVILSGVFGILSYLRQIRGYLIVCIVLSVLASTSAIANSTYYLLMAIRYFQHFDAAEKACSALSLSCSVLEVIFGIAQAVCMCLIACPGCCCQRLAPERSQAPAEAQRHEFSTAHGDFEPLPLLADQDDHLIH